jgi:hypothetical protein
MKKVTLLAVAAFAVLSMTSCKKDRVCTCTTTTNGVVGTPQVVTYTKAKKSAAMANCLDASGTETYGGTTYVSTRDCTLK